jgi:hypothetical protein
MTNETKTYTCFYGSHTAMKLIYNVCKNDIISFWLRNGFCCNILEITQVALINVMLNIDERPKNIHSYEYKIHGERTKGVFLNVIKN